MAKTLIENVVEIEKPPAVVFDYASDHTHESEWNPKMRSVRKLTDGPIGNGTKYEMEFLPGRPVVVTCIRFDRPDRWEAVGDTLGMHISLGGEVTPIACALAWPSAPSSRPRDCWGWRYHVLDVA